MTAPLLPLAVPAKPRVSVEMLLRWAFAPGRDGGAAWRVDAGLAFDQGLTARPRRRAAGSWTLAEACAGMRFGRGPALDMGATADADAVLVASAVAALPGAVAERVRAHARAGSRPDWLDTEKRLEGVFTANRPGARVGKVEWTNNRHKKVQFCRLQLVIRRDLTDASKRRWRDWRGALAEIDRRLAGRLARWELNGYLPIEDPWKGLKR